MTSQEEAIDLLRTMSVLRMPLSDWLNFGLWLAGSGLCLYAEWIMPAIGGAP